MFACFDELRLNATWFKAMDGRCVNTCTNSEDGRLHASLVGT